MEGTSGKVVWELSEESEDRLNRAYPAQRYVHLVRVDPGAWVLPRKVDLDAIKGFRLYEDDVVIVTPPKSGTTWMQEIVWLMRHQLDTDSAKVNQFFRVPFLEMEAFRRSQGSFSSWLKKVGLDSDIEKASETAPLDPCLPRTEANAPRFMLHSLEFCRNLQRPRTIKTHLPLSLLPDGLLDTCKVVYVARNVKDVAVSFYYHQKLGQEIGDFAAFARCFRHSEVPYGPFFDHVLEAWNQRDHRNLFFTTYEDLSRDFANVVENLAVFLLGPQGKHLDFRRLKEEVSIERFRTNDYVNKSRELPPDGKGNSFIRKGQVGDWKNHFTVAMNEEWDAWIESSLRGTGFEMTFE